MAVTASAQCGKYVGIHPRPCMHAQQQSRRHIIALQRKDQAPRIVCRAQRPSEGQLKERDAGNATDSSSNGAGNQKQHRGSGLGDLLGPIGLTIGGGASKV